MKFYKFQQILLAKQLHKSFTLIELLVSMGIIVVVVLAAAGIYLQVIGTRQKTLGQLNMQEDAQYIMSLMVKDIRENKVDYGSNGYGGGLCGVLTSPPATALCLINFASDPTKIRYIEEQSGSRYVLKRCEETGNACNLPTNYHTITMTNLSIERLDFYISPISDPFTAGSTTYEHPRVTVVLKVKSLIEKIGEAELVFQQTVPQRYELKK